MAWPRITRLLTQPEIDRLVDMKTAIRVVEQAFLAQARGEVLMPPKLYLRLPDGSDFRAMPSALLRPGFAAVAGLKWVNVHPGNRSKGLPTVMATIVLNDAATGFPLAIMDGLSITRLRTGAATGVATKALAKPRIDRLGLVGCGAQAWYQLEAVLQVRRVREVAVWGFRPGEARRFCDRVRRRVAAALVPVSSVRACVEGADLVVTITSSRRPLVQRAWVAPGTHVNAIGADAPGKQELDPQVLRAATVVVDDLAQAVHGGEINVPVARGQFSRRAIHATLGEVLLGRAPGRTHRDEITVFDSTGLAVHDLALGYEVYRRALRRKVGHAIRLFLATSSP